MEEDRLSALNAQALSLLTAMAAARGVDVREARPLINHILVANRQLMNQAGGYWILEPFGRGVAQASVRQVPLGEVRDVLLMTDGFSAAHDVLPLFSNAPELLGAVRDRGVEAVARRIEEEFAADPSWNRYPRFKQIDDMTALHVEAAAGSAAVGVRGH
jgi:hypothetical protein